MSMVLRPFVNLVKTSTSCCPGPRFFKDTDVINFYYSYAFNLRASDRPDAVGALKDIAYTQRDSIGRHTFEQMCKFFLDHASRPIVNRAIRSIFWCFGVRLRNPKVDDNKSYMELLGDVDAAAALLSGRQRSDDTQRAAIVVLLANEEKHNQVKHYLDTHADERLWILFLHGGYNLYRDAPPAILDNEKCVLLAMQYDKRAFRWASPRIHAKRSIVMRAVRKWGWLLQYVSEDLKDDLDVVRIAVMQNGAVIRCASQRLRNHRELAMLALSDPNRLDEVYRFLSYDLRNDEELALLALQRGERDVLEHVSERLRLLRRFVLIAVRYDGGNLEFAPPEFQDDYEIVMTAVTSGSNGEALQYASLRLKGVRRIVMEAIMHSNGHALQFASLDLKDDYQIVKRAYYLDHNMLDFASERLQNSTRWRFASPQLR